MKTLTVKPLTVVITTIALLLLASCIGSSGNEILDDQSGLILTPDDFKITRNDNGELTFKNTVTGETTIKNVKIEWTQVSHKDSLAVFCSGGKRGYYNAYTGRIVVPAQYRRAWIFSEGLGAVEKNGNIGFIDRKGNVVIDFKFPYHGNPLTDFLFEDGHCVVADTSGHCGVIDKAGAWLILPEYDNVSTFADYAIVSRSGVRRQMNYDGTTINGLVLDDIRVLGYETYETRVNEKGLFQEVSFSHSTELYAYRVGGRWGLMDKNLNRLTEPLYASIETPDGHIFRATLLDHYSEVILDEKGNILN